MYHRLALAILHGSIHRAVYWLSLDFHESAVLVNVLGGAIRAYRSVHVHGDADLRRCPGVKLSAPVLSDVALNRWRGGLAGY